MEDLLRQWNANSIFRRDSQAILDSARGDHKADKSELIYQMESK